MVFIEDKYIERIKGFSRLIIQSTLKQGFDTVDDYIKYFSYAKKYNYMVTIINEGHARRIQIDYTFNRVVGFICSIRRLDPRTELEVYLGNTNRLFGGKDDNVYDEVINLYKEIAKVKEDNKHILIHNMILNVNKFDFSRLNKLTKLEKKFVSNMIRKRGNEQYFKLINMFLCISTNKHYTDIEEFCNEELLAKKKSNTDKRDRVTYTNDELNRPHITTQVINVTQV